MGTTIKTNQSGSTLTIKEDFNVILEENFTAICKAIANRGVALKELQSLFERDDHIVDEIVTIIRSARDEYLAANDLCVKLGVSEPTAQYILVLRLSTLFSLSENFLKRECDEYKRLVASLSV